MFVSTDGRTFREPNPNWKPAVAGSSTGGQSLVGDLIREGITGVVGHVAEPFLDAIVRPQILFPAYLSGFNLAESFYLSMPFLSWQDIVVGDPLCAPFQSAPVAQEQLYRGLDQATSLPALFAERRLTQWKASAPGLNAEGLTLDLRGWSLLAQGKPDTEVDAVLERATLLEPKLVASQLRLAAAAEKRMDVDEAIERYRAVLTAEPRNLFALNNLAFSLADKKGQAKEALPLAERAYRLAGPAASVADTLGWVHFKLGDTAQALPLLDRAAKDAPGNVDILVHAAAAHAASGNIVQARRYVDAALKADPKAAERPDVKALLGKLGI
jgi:tetratricopeptide (TPR) repeat protein